MTFVYTKDEEYIGEISIVFNIPAKYQPELLLPIGYIDRKPSILRERRKSIEELVKYNKY